MGCSSSSDPYEPLAFDQKATVWFLGGGPGSPKQVFAQFLTQNYKFKYLSAVQLIHFESSSGSPEGLQIKKLVEQGKDLPSGLIIKILKKVMNLYGARKYLIDNFPRNMSDVNQFQSLCSKYMTQLSCEGYFQLDLSQIQMKESGMDTLSKLKQDSLQNIEKEVRLIIENYRAKSKQIIEYYSLQKKLISLDFINKDTQMLNETAKKSIALNGMAPVRGVPFLFLDGNDEKDIYRIGLRVSRMLGLKFWSIGQLIEEYKSKPELKKQIENQGRQLPSQILVQLIIKKLDRYNYKGKYLISGFPRHQNDVLALKDKFHQEIKFLAYAGCLHTPTTSKQQERFENMLKYLASQQIHSILVNSSERQFEIIKEHLSKVAVTSSSIQTQRRATLMLSFEKTGQQYVIKLEEWCEVINFQSLIKEEIKRGKFYSALLTSCIQLEKPVPSTIAVQIFLQKILRINQKPVVIRDFPQNKQQLKILLQKSKDITVLASLLIESPKSAKSTQKLAIYKELQQSLAVSSDKALIINEKMTYQQLKMFMNSL